ncbi:hypothetical protein ACNQFZ_13740 [Schinkia sp. CFF1]
MVKKKICVLSIFSFLLILFLLIGQLTNLNSYASTYDQVDFALALERYDLLAMQPHFPGYPYFILGGYFFHQWISDKAASLTLFNIIMYASAVIPIYRLSRIKFSKPLSLLISALVYSAGYVILMVNQPMSEGAAVAVLWWYIWSIYVADEKQNLWSKILPLLLLSVLLGIRLSYLPFSIGIVLPFYKQWKNRKLEIKQIATLGLLAIFFQLLWVGAVAVTEGSLLGFMKLALAFTDGHFNDWGGTVASTNGSLLERAFKLIGINIIWIGTAVGSYLIAGMYIIYIFCILKAVHWDILKKLKHNFLAQLLMVLISSYFLWALFAQNIDKPRHIIPIVSLSLFCLFVVVLSKFQNRMMIAFSCVFLCIHAYHTISLLNEQVNALPATYQLADYLEKKGNQFVVYTWEESRVFTYLDEPFSYKEIYTYSKFLHDKSYYKNKEILLTDKVVEGFKSQGVDLTGRVEVVKKFSSNSLFEPVYNKIALYRWESGNLGN